MKTRVAILRGGPSGEHDVSLKTGASVLGALDPDRYVATDVLISRQGKWHSNGYEMSPQQIIESSDVIFNALHGAYGEDGVLQRELDRYKVPYTGSGAFGAAAAMNKYQTKKILESLGVKMAQHMRVQHDQSNNYDLLANSISKEFGPKYVVKPVAGGSSLNTLIVDNISDLSEAVKKVVEEDGEALVEEYIDGVEATCGVIENFRGQKVYSLPVVEILPPAGSVFFDHEAKYSGNSEELCPGRFNSRIKKNIESLAIAVHEALDLSQYSRSDFIIASDGVYFLEVNTLPGMTEQSLLPLSLDAVGVNYKDFVDHLIQDALNKRR